MDTFFYGILAGVVATLVLEHGGAKLVWSLIASKFGKGAASSTSTTSSTTDTKK